MTKMNYQANSCIFMCVVIARVQNACGCIVGLALRSCRQNKLGALVGQRQRRLKPDAAVCTGEHSPASSLRGNIFGSPFGLHEASIRVSALARHAGAKTN
jgi:hypothetical protein